MGLLSRAFADQTARIVQELDFALADFAEWNARADGTVATPDIVREQLLTHIARLPYVHSAAVFGTDGLRRATTESSPPTGVSIAGAPIFSVPQYTQPDALYIGTPRVGRFDGYRTFAVSRRLRTADGRFAGVVVVRVAFEYLARFYAAVDIRPGAEIRLLRTDGIDLAHYPSVVSVSQSALPATKISPPGSDGKRIISRQARLRLSAGGRGGSALGASISALVAAGTGQRRAHDRTGGTGRPAAGCACHSGAAPGRSRSGPSRLRVAAAGGAQGRGDQPAGGLGGARFQQRTGRDRWLW